jgi:hypothetical protein
MIFWLGIILALAAAFLASKKGLYESWSMLFNVIISVYLGLTAGPTMAKLMGATSVNGELLTIFGTAALCFIILYGASYVIFLSQFNVTFPKIFDIAGGGLTGFLAAFLAWSFIAFLICSCPAAQNSFISKMGFNKTKLSGTISYMQNFTGIVHSMVAADQEQSSLKDKIITMIEESEKARPKRTLKTEPEEEIEPVEEEIVEKKITPSDLGPPPELDFEDI